MMIDVNLIPPELRKNKKEGLLGKLNIPLEVIVGSVVGLVFLLIGAHVLLLFINVTRLAQHKTLKTKWAELEPEKKEVDAVIKDLHSMKKQIDDIKKVTQKKEFHWSQKLNLISSNLPRGVWLRKVVLSSDLFYLEGSAISKKGDELIAVHKFTSNLKASEEFLEGLSSFELDSIQRRKIRTVDIADFLITTEAKE